MGGFEPGEKVLGFKLKNANEKYDSEVSLDGIIGLKGAIIVFECNHCPYVIGSIDRINKIANLANANGLGFLGINSNDSINYPDDSFDAMQKRASRGMPYPYLHDETQQVAKDWGAERTPEFYLIDQNKVVIYRGRMDNSPKNPVEATSSELSDAIEALLSKKTPKILRTDSIGCSVKWK